MLALPVTLDYSTTHGQRGVVQSSNREIDMNTQIALLLSAVEACEAIDRVAEVAERSAGSMQELWDVHAKTESDFKKAYVGIRSNLADAAFGGDAFAKAWISQAFGERRHDADGEEFGGYHVMPSRELVNERIEATPAKNARAILRNLASE